MPATNSLPPVSFSALNRVKYAALSFSRSLSATSGNSAPGTETVIYCADTQDITGLPDGGCINSNGSQPGWRSNYRGDYKDRNLKPICSQDLLSWAFQVARGMEYLCQRKVSCSPLFGLSFKFQHLKMFLNCYIWVGLTRWFGGKKYSTGRKQCCENLRLWTS